MLKLDGQLIEHYVSAARALDDMRTVQIVGIDDTSLHKGRCTNAPGVRHFLGPSQSPTRRCTGVARRGNPLAFFRRLSATEFWVVFLWTVQWIVGINDYCIVTCC